MPQNLEVNFDHYGDALVYDESGALILSVHTPNLDDDSPKALRAEIRCRLPAHLKSAWIHFNDDD